MSGTTVTHDRGTVVEDARDAGALLARRWVVIVWNDPINLMTYVTYVFRKLFGYSHPKAHALMLQVHHEGRAVVSGGTLERCEHDAARLHAHGLWATIAQG
jgi:ATP-dependent Clp protease adaptor protein ClpS